MLVSLSPSHLQANIASVVYVMDCLGQAIHSCIMFCVVYGGIFPLPTSNFCNIGRSSCISTKNHHLALNRWFVQTPLRQVLSGGRLGLSPRAPCHPPAPGPPHRPPPTPQPPLPPPMTLTTEGPVGALPQAIEGSSCLCVLCCLSRYRLFAVGCVCALVDPDAYWVALYSVCRILCVLL